MARKGRDRDRAVAWAGDRGKQRVQGQSRRGTILKTRDLHREVIGMNRIIRFVRRFCLIALSAGLLPLTGCVFARGQRYHHFTTPTPLEENKILILGFLGGREPWDNPHRNVRKLALKLRAQYSDKAW